MQISEVESAKTDKRKYFDRERAGEAEITIGHASTCHGGVEAWPIVNSKNKSSSKEQWMVMNKILTLTLAETLASSSMWIGW